MSTLFNISDKIKATFIEGLIEGRFVLLVDSEESGVSANNQFEITGASVSTGTTFPVTFAPESNPYNQTDVTVDVSNPTITFPTAGKYFVQIGGAFERIQFDVGGDKDKLLEIVQWGNLTWSSFESAFEGCGNNSKLPDGAMTGDFSAVTTFERCFRQNNIASIPEGLFDNTPAVTSFNRLFQSNSITSIPVGLFDNTTQVTDFFNCFLDNDLTSIPEGLFDNTIAVTDFANCFRDNDLTSIPEGLFDNNTAVTSFFRCFEGNELTSLPAGLFDNTTAVTRFDRCFQDNSITSIPAGLFNNNTLADDFDDCFQDNTLNTPDLSRLYCELSVFNQNTNVPFHGGSGNYDPFLFFDVDGTMVNVGDARQTLLDRGWTLTDGGATNQFDSNDFILLVDSEESGVSNNNQFEITGAEVSTGSTFPVKFSPQDDPYNFTQVTVDVSNPTITFPTAGRYFVQIGQPFNRIQFDDGGDKDKLLEIVQWGNLTWSNFRNAFFGCSNNSKLPDGAMTGDFSAVGVFTSCFRDNNITSIPAGLFDNTTAVENFSDCFRDNNLTSIPEGLFDNTTVVTTFRRCFLSNNLTSLPAGLFDNTTAVSDFNNCFFGNTLDTADLSRLYCELSVFNENTNVLFHGGSGNYDPFLFFEVDGATINVGDARQTLLDRGWLLTDGGATNEFDSDDFILLVDSEESGVSTNNEFEITGAEVSTGTTFPVKFSPQEDPYNFTQITVDVSDPTITFPTAGRYFVQIGQPFNRIQFDRAGDVNKPLEIVQWGDLTWSSFENAFDQGNLTKLPDGAMTGDFSAVTSFGSCFRFNNLTSIPDGLFDNTTAVTDFNRCFQNNNITSIPAGLFDNTTAVIDFELCFRENFLTSIPAGLFDNTTQVTRFNRCFENNDLTSIPAGLFDNTTLVTTFVRCFENNDLTSIPAGLFDNNTLADDFAQCFLDNTLNTADLSRLYCELSVFNENTNVPFGGGSGNYDPALNFTVDGQTVNTGDARDELAIDRGWTLVDGGAI